MALRRLMESDTEVDIQIRREADKETDIRWSVKGWLDWWKRRRERDRMNRRGRHEVWIGHEGWGEYWK